MAMVSVRISNFAVGLLYGFGTGVKDELSHSNIEPNAQKICRGNSLFITVLKVWGKSAGLTKSGMAHALVTAMLTSNASVALRELVEIGAAGGPAPRRPAEMWMDALAATAAIEDHPHRTLPAIVSEFAARQPGAPALM